MWNCRCCGELLLWVLQNAALARYGGLSHAHFAVALSPWGVVPVGSLSWHCGGARPEEQEGKCLL